MEMTQEVSFSTPDESNISPQPNEENIRLTGEITPEITEVRFSPEITGFSTQSTDASLHPEVTSASHRTEANTAREVPLQDPEASEISEEVKAELVSAQITAVRCPSSEAIISRGSAREDRLAEQKTAPQPPPPPPASYEPASVPVSATHFSAVLDLLYWRNLSWSAAVLSSSLLLLLFLSSCSIISVIAYGVLTLLSVTVTFRIYKGILQAIQKSDEGHPFKQYLDKDVALSKDLVQKYTDMALGQINSGLIALRRLFLVEDLVDSLKFAVILWIFTYVGSWFNGLTLVILGVLGAFSCPVMYKIHQTDIDQYVNMMKNQMKEIVGKVEAKVPGMKKLE